MELPSWLVLCIIAGCLVIGGMIGHPYPVSIEQWERTGFEAQLQAKDDVYNALNQNWIVYQEECEDYQTTIRAEEEQECALEKAVTAKRVAERNQELIEINDDWQDLFEDLNYTISIGLKDINAAIADGNCC